MMTPSRSAAAATYPTMTHDVDAPVGGWRLHLVMKNAMTSCRADPGPQGVHELGRHDGVHREAQHGGARRRRGKALGPRLGCDAEPHRRKREGAERSCSTETDTNTS